MAICLEELKPQKTCQDDQSPAGIQNGYLLKTGQMCYCCVNLFNSNIKSNSGMQLPYFYFICAIISCTLNVLEGTMLTCL